MLSSKPIEPLRGRSFEELEVGQWLQGPGQTVTEASIIDFAAEWDPQPFHIDKTAAAISVFGQLVGSGLHTLLLSYKLYYEAGLVRGTAVAGLGIDDIRFLKPLVPGDTISIRIFVAEKFPPTKPTSGKVRLRVETHNQGGEMIFHMSLLALIARERNED